MAPNRKRTRWTYAEFARLPSEGSTRYEVIDGELVVTPAPSRGHQRVSVLLSSLLHGFVTAHDLGEVYHAPFDVLFAEGDYVEPDIVFVRRERLDILSDRGCEAAPDLIVEIVSPSTAARDRGVKRDRYRLFGVPEYWIVDTDAATMEVWKLGAGSEAPELLGSDDVMRWTPAPDAAPVLEFTVREILPER